MEMTSSAGAAPLARWERAGLIALAIAFLVFGGLVELRSAFQQQRKTDFGVYARAAYVIRAGEDLYEVYDNNGWHYVYPVAFAVAMIPLADPWPWVDRTGYLPYEVSVGVWYLLSLVFTAYALHVLARAVVPDAVPGSRRWWYARTMPMMICLGGIGCTLSRGQVNLLLVALLAGMFAAWIGRRKLASGVWLAAAITLKIIPAVLLLIPFVRRDWRAGSGVVFGLAVGFFLIPSLAIGWSAAWDANLRVVDSVLRPAATGGGDQTRAKELTSTAATDNQSFAAIIHNLRHPDRASRPLDADRLTKFMHLLVAVALAGICLVVGWRNLGEHPADRLVYFGAVALLMMLMSPVSHMHYYVFALPLVVGLWGRSLAQRPGAVFADRRTLSLLFAWGIITGFALLPISWLRDARSFGLCTGCTVALWAYGLALVAWRPLGLATEKERLSDTESVGDSRPLNRVAA